MMWISLLVDDDTFDELRNLDGMPYVYELTAQDAEAWGLLPNRLRWKVHEVNVEDERWGLPK